MTPMPTRILVAGLVALMLTGCGQAAFRPAGAPVPGSFAAMEADEAARKKKKAPAKKGEEAGKVVTGRVSIKLSGYWKDGSFLLTLEDAKGASVGVLIGAETVIADAKGKPVAAEKLKMGMTLEVTCGAVSKVVSQPTTYEATKVVVVKAAASGGKTVHFDL